MDMISSSMPAVSILENFNRSSKYKIHIGANRYNSRICALKFRESTSTQQVFDEMPLSTDSLAWNTVIQTHLENLDYSKAVTTYHGMLSRGVRPDRHTLPRILSVSRLSGSLSLGKQLHGQAVKLGVSNDVYVTGGLIQLYGHLDGVDAAKWVLDNSEKKMSSVSWTLLAKLYIKQNKPALAIDLFNEMVESDAEVDAVSLTTAISACVLLKSLKVGRNIHQTARKHGLELDLLMPSRDAISWTSIIQGLHGRGDLGVELFQKIPTIDIDEISYVTALFACCTACMVEEGLILIGSLRVDHPMSQMKAETSIKETAREVIQKESLPKGSVFGILRPHQ
ncbi:hypothetical protein L6452_22339 [Arctium lappa]|uniref:Uncharacterized protein n=1 Tax=Arctium lappa TaxID=4217 RepID=A0ACB9B0F9_ARCLA|nr:hypothetical protein L6452_22339 [Arctium lappa]